MIIKSIHKFRNRNLLIRNQIDFQIMKQKQKQKSRTKKTGTKINFHKWISKSGTIKEISKLGTKINYLSSDGGRQRRVAVVDERREARVRVRVVRMVLVCEGCERDEREGEGNGKFV